MTASPLIHGSVATFRSCWSATSSTVAGSVHIRIGTFAPGISTYDITSSFPRKKIKSLETQNRRKVDVTDNGPAFTAVRAIHIVSRASPGTSSD
ncbi:hypothetical protein SSP24_23710 [Streptomyces spinoverrucosus]|uniref:Uncharacterized protein n=1 Tax=Streptomyces spinoverrucosus TaxID=284043 RepID=A0A4Y3VI59_9ACTN|nr:hypothetical protein SSP24_23710 [Streptomyces spinoverrucosus]GHB59141.1 hypothetical protein GCM10010397_31550 [Streptomyces spinoverrucosus]